MVVSTGKYRRVDAFPPLVRGTRNHLVAALHGMEAADLIAAATPVTWQAGQVLLTAEQAIQTLWFPDTAIAAVVERRSNGTRTQIGMIGCEGVIGWQALFGAGSAGHGVLVDMAGGTAHAVPVEVVRAACARSQRLCALLLAYVHSFTAQIGCAVTSTLRDGIDRRLSRWLLMFHDRVEGDELALTHHHLADLLQVRRASITDCLHVLEGERLVRCTRGRIVIRDRSGLQARAGEGYGTPERLYHERVGPFGKAADGAEGEPG